MDRLEAMSMLVRVSEAGSFTAAARALHVPLTTLSRKIADLEAHVGARLLLRTTRRLAVTDAGATYLAAARRILEQVEAAEHEASGELTQPRGQLVLTAPLHFGRLHVLPIVADFLAELPEIDVRLVLSDQNVDLVEDHVDMAVRIGPLRDSTMIATRVGSTRSVTCASPSLLTRVGSPRQPSDLRRLPCVAVSAPMLQPSWRFRRPRTGASLEVPLAPRLIVSTTEAATEAAVLGVGLARLLHYQVAEAVAAGSLRIVLAAHEPEPVPVHVVHAPRGALPRKMRSFLDFAVPRLRAALTHRRRTLGR